MNLPRRKVENQPSTVSVNKNNQSYLDFVEKYAYSAKERSNPTKAQVSTKKLISQSKMNIIDKGLAKQSASINGFLSKKMASVKADTKISVFAPENPEDSQDLLMQSSKSNLRPFGKKPNVYDSAEEEELSGEEDFPSLCIPLSSNFRRVWDIYTVIVITYVVLVTPFKLAFNLSNDSNLSQILELIADLSLLLDLILNFFFSYIDSQDTEVLSFRKITRNYLTSWFLFDFASSIPFDSLQIFFDSEKQNYFAITRFFKFYRVIRWIRIFKVFKVVKRKVGSDLEETSDGDKFSKALVVLLAVCVVLHSFACLFIFIGRDNTEGWIMVNHLESSDEFEIYVTSLYFHIVTMLSVGYGDVKTYSLRERVYACIFLCLGLFLYSCTITFVSSYFSRTSEREIKRDKQVKILDDINKSYSLDRDLYFSLKANIYEQFKKIALEKYKLLERLPAIYRNNIIYKMHSTHIQNLHFLREQSHDFIIGVLPKMKPLRVEKTDVLMSEGEHVDEMYLVTKGRLTLSTMFNEISYDVAYIRQNFHFGDYFMYFNLQSPYSLTNKKPSTEVLVFKKKDFNQVRIDFNENLALILGKSKGLVDIIEKRRYLTEILTKEDSDPKEVKRKLKLIDHQILNSSLKNAVEEGKWESNCEERIKHIYDVLSLKIKESQGKYEDRIRDIGLEQSLSEGPQIVSESPSFDVFIKSTVQKANTLRNSESELEVVSYKEEANSRGNSRRNSLFVINEQKAFVTVVEKPKPTFQKCSFGFSVKGRKPKLVIQSVTSIQIEQSGRSALLKDRVLSLDSTDPHQVSLAAQSLARHNRSSVLGMDFLKFDSESKQLSKQKMKIKRAITKKSCTNSQGTRLKLKDDKSENFTEQNVHSSLHNLTQDGRISPDFLVNRRKLPSEVKKIDLGNCSMLSPDLSKRRVKFGSRTPDKESSSIIHANYRIEKKLDKLLSLMKELR